MEPKGNEQAPIGHQVPSEGKKRYVGIRLHGGGSYLQKPEDLAQALDGELADLFFLEPGEEITLSFSTHWLTDEEYEAKGEFQGH